MIDIKKILMVSSVGLMLVSPVVAEGPRVKMKEELRAEANEKMGSRPGLLKKTFGLQGKAAIGSGQVTAKDGTTLTVTSDGKTYTIQTDTKTQFRFKFWGKGSLEAIAVGHTVNVIGKWQDDAHTTVMARLVRDVSLQKRFGVFIGEIKSLLTGGWIMSTKSEKRADQAVTISTSTKFVNRNEEPIVQSDVVVGHKVRVKGLWDSVANTVTEVTHVKDFSLPLKPTPTP